MDWREIDYKKNSTNYIIHSLNGVIDEICKETDENLLLDEITPVIGLCFISLQNYINHTISLLFPDKKRHLFYNLGEDKNNKIELIIVLANVAKHKEEEGYESFLKKHTVNKLKFFGLDPKDSTPDIIIKGLNILDSNTDIIQVMNIVFEWREKLLVKFKSQPEFVNYYSLKNK